MTYLLRLLFKVLSVNQAFLRPPWPLNKAKQKKNSFLREKNTAGVEWRLQTG